MNICINNECIKTCVSTIEDCCAPENSVRVQRVTSAELVNISSKGLEDIEDAQGIADELSKLADSSKRASKASLTGLEHRIYALCQKMYSKHTIIYLNLLMDSVEKNTDVSQLAPSNITK
jgi:hypothetical protein